MKFLSALFAVLLSCSLAYADGRDSGADSVVIHATRTISLPGGNAVIVRSVGAKTGQGVTWREYKTRGGLFLGVTWKGPATMASPNCNLMLHTLFGMLPGQLPGQTTSRFITVIDWNKTTVYGRMYVPQLFPKGFHVADLQ